MVLTAVEEGKDTVQCIIQEKIADLSKKNFGMRDYSWMVSGCHTRPDGESKLWSNFAGVWNKLKKDVKPKKLENWLQKKNLPLWVPHVLHNTTEKVGATQVKKKELVKGGIVVLGDVLDRQGSFLAWNDIQQNFWNFNCPAAYTKLIANIDLSKTRIHSTNKKRKAFFYEGSLKNGVTIWEMEVSPHDLQDTLRVDSRMQPPKRTYTLEQNKLSRAKISLPLRDSLLKRIIVGLPQQDIEGRKQLTVIGRMQDNIAIIETENGQMELHSLM